MTSRTIQRLLITGLLLGTAAGARQPPAELDAAVRLFEAGRLKAARERLETLWKAGRTPFETAFFLGRVELSAGDLKTASRWLERATREKPRDADAWLWLGHSYGRRALLSELMGKVSLGLKARRAYERAAAYDPEHGLSRYWLVRYYHAAPAIGGGGRTKAERLARQLLEIDPVLGHRALGAIARSEKRHTAALEHFRAAVQAAPEDLGSLYDLGYTYQETQRYTEAFATFARVLERPRPDPNAWLQIGRTAVFSGQRQAWGEECLRRYIESRGPEVRTAEGYWWLGQLYERAGEAEQAAESYREALDAEPSHQEARQALQALGEE